MAQDDTVRSGFSCKPDGVHTAFSRFVQGMGGVGAGGEKPPATQLAKIYIFQNHFKP